MDRARGGRQSSPTEFVMSASDTFTHKKLNRSMRSPLICRRSDFRATQDGVESVGIAQFKTAFEGTVSRARADVSEPSGALPMADRNWPIRDGMAFQDQVKDAVECWANN